MKFDPTTLEVLWTRLRSVTDEAAKVIVRTSFSTLSIEANDYSCVLTDAQGNSLAQNTASIPSFIATLPATTRHMLKAIGAASMRAGDIYITNNPWMGTGHLNDISLVKPVFLGARLVAFAATTSHVPDIGGRIRSAEPREIYEEGFHIPPMRLLAAGVPDESLLTLLRTNVRTPDQTVGDIFAQASALGLMETRVLEIMHDHGLADLDSLGAQLFGLAENAMRAAISAVPEGTYTNEFLTDGLEEPFQFRVAVTVKGGEILADFTGTSMQQPRAINCVMAYTYAMTAYAIKAALLPDLPNNEGMFRPIKVAAPEGCLLNPRYPASTGGRAATGHYVPPLIYGALAKVIPERVMSAPGSPLWIFTVAGVRADGKSFANVFFYNGGMGATAQKDGESAVSWPSNISSTPSEIVERDTPFITYYKRLRPGSGGAGQFRGGLGQEVLLENRHPTPLPILFITERLKFPAPGLAGGGAGALGEVLINGQPLADPRAQAILACGDQLLLRTPGGGGYGEPAERDPRARERDREARLRMKGDPECYVVERFAKYAVDTRAQPIAPEALHHAKRAVIDWYAALYPGAVVAPATLLEKALAEDLDRGKARLALGRKGSTRAVALINGTASHTLEVDDIFKFGIYHPGAPTIAAALAVAQAAEVTGEAFLRAVIVGYEISTRIGAAMGRAHYKYWHNTGTIGTFGAAAAAAEIHGLDAKRFSHSLATAATFAAALQQAFRMDSMSKPLHAGHAAEAGVLAAAGAREGVTGSLDVIEGEAGFGRAMSDGPDWDKALETLGREHHVTMMTFKNHACCGHTFAAIDGAQELQRRLKVKPADIARIKVGSYRAAKEVSGYENPTTAAEARFSLKYVVANALVHGSVRLAAFEPARMNDSVTRELMKKIEVTIDPELDAAFPNQRAARVAIETKDGRKAEYLQPARKGDPELPLTDRELEDKYLELASPVIGEASAKALVAKLWKLEKVSNLSSDLA